MIKTASLSDTGRIRQLNQDVVYTSELPIGNLPNLFLLADGMGGHKAGDYASRYAVDTICEEARESHEQNPEHILKKAYGEFGETLEGAAEAIWQYNKEIVDATYDLIPADIGI